MLGKCSPLLRRTRRWPIGSGTVYAASKNTKDIYIYSAYGYKSIWICLKASELSSCCIRIQITMATDFLQLSLSTANLKGQSQYISMIRCNWSSDYRSPIGQNAPRSKCFLLHLKAWVIGSLRRCGCEHHVPWCSLVQCVWICGGWSTVSSHQHIHTKKKLTYILAHTSISMPPLFPIVALAPNCSWSAIAIQPQCEVFRFCTQFLYVFLWWNTTPKPQQMSQVIEGSRCNYISIFIPNTCNI